ncbi:hypothetical protein IG631_02548 [Alternaria alternata]|nr:hypothetical protein IG631_02548 [Alternaria alternata]
MGDTRLRSMFKRARKQVRLYRLRTAISIAPADVQSKANAEVSQILRADDVGLIFAGVKIDVDFHPANFQWLG